MPPPSTATGVVRLTAGDDRADIASVQAGTYSATVVPGTYELGYNLNTGLDAAIPLGRTVTIDETSTLDVDIPMATVFGNLTVDGQPLAPGSSYAYFTFRSSNGLEAAWGTIESGSYSVELPAGTYDVLYSSDQGGGEIPQNQSATIFRGLTIEEDQRLDIDIPMVTLSGQLTAAVLPAGASSLYVTTDDGDFALLADIHDGIYSARLTPGAYDVRVGELVGPGFRNEDLGEPLAQVALDDSKTLDLDVPAVTITGAVTLNGARASFGYDAGLYLLGTSNRYVQIPHLDIPGYTAKIVPGTYDIVYYGAGTVDTSRGYSSNPDDGIPDNPSVVVRSGVEISTSQTLDIDVPMVVITGKIGVNGGPAEPGREGILYFVTAGGDPFIAETTAATSYRVELVPGTYSVFYLRSGDTMVNGQFATVLSNIQLDRDGTVDLELTMKHLSGSVTVNGAVPPSGVAYLWLMGTDYADLEWGSGIQPTYDTEVIPETYDIRYADWSYGAGLPFNQFAKIGCIRIE